MSDVEGTSDFEDQVVTPLNDSKTSKSETRKIVETALIHISILVVIITSFVFIGTTSNDQVRTIFSNLASTFCGLLIPTPGNLSTVFGRLKTKSIDLVDSIRDKKARGKKKSNGFPKLSSNTFESKLDPKVSERLCHKFGEHDPTKEISGTVDEIDCN